jgi:hypothetical protein
MSSSKRLLDPIDRTSEVLFGLIMALSFTCSLSAAEAGREDVRTMMIGALGCNVAWGMIDAVIFLMVSTTERARGFSLLRSLRSAGSDENARAIIADALPPLVAQTLGDDDYARLRQKLAATSQLPERPRLGQSDYLAALGVFLLVFLATFPVVIPFMFMKDTVAALRVSNGIAIGMLFLAGWALGRYAQHRPLLMGILMTVIGAVLVALTIALGG